MKVLFRRLKQEATVVATRKEVSKKVGRDLLSLRAYHRVVPQLMKTPDNDHAKGHIFSHGGPSLTSNLRRHAVNRVSIGLAHLNLGYGCYFSSIRPQEE